MGLQHKNDSTDPKEIEAMRKSSFATPNSKHNFMARQFAGDVVDEYQRTLMIKKIEEQQPKKG